MFPRSGSMDSEGSSASSWARRRADAVPTRIPGAKRSLPTSASRASSRGGYAPTTSPAVSVDVMSFAEWTATSIRPSSKRLLELLHEDAPLADLAERLAAVAVAGRRDRDERDLDAPSRA